MRCQYDSRRHVNMIALDSGITRLCISHAHRLLSWRLKIQEKNKTGSLRFKGNLIAVIN